MRHSLKEFREIWLVDSEFTAPDGERPTPICMVAREYRTGQVIQLWEDDLRSLDTPPFSIGFDSLFVAYYASAELGCHLSLDWPIPAWVLDLFAEFKNETNGQRRPAGAGLLGALTYYGIDGMAAVEKETMRHLALRGGPWTDNERHALLEYCDADVIALEKLLTCMAPNLDLPRALIRGRYMAAAARVEQTGVPIDIVALGVLRENWSELQGRLIERIDRDYGVFEGQTFKADRWAVWLAFHGIPWPEPVNDFETPDFAIY